ncbi:hypothetical protein DSM110093_03948 (plasmid) [Sulfitobacter sp. DSM 110093]|uniref:hypothetical protein n=1 Tax=Sulfitobacter sp. DSM 110093 TaxID=2883127 RepID=UPI001FAC8CBC|nr:hypothetical protein [Sulfitobacter sp. DSM 110093]UOA34113.1 hypothetical protein DSM110093_03948 [Sulfitobacter sp. DSM 110093]
MKVKSFATFAGGFAALAGLYLLIDHQSTNATYRGIWILPLTFVMVVLGMSGVRKFGFTFAFLTTLFFVRLVLTPLAIHFAGPDYTALSYLSVTTDEVFNAILLISWESIAATLFFVVAAGAIARMRPVAEPAVPPVSLQGSQIVYGAVAMIGLVLIVTFGLPRGLLNFGSITMGTVEAERSSIDMLLIQIMITGAWLMYLLTIHRQALRYRRNPTRMPPLVGIAAGVLLLMLIFGDRRSIQLYTGIAVTTTLFACFPDRKRVIVSSTVITTVAVIAIVSFWRMFTRHDIELTSATLLGQSLMATIATTLQSYSGGPYQVAAANGILLSEDVGLGNVVFDFLRSTFVVNFFVNDSRMLTSQIMNANIYDGNFLTGWLVFTTSYGAISLGPVFMPLFLILNISLAMMSESVFRRARGLEVRFLFIYLFARMSLFPFNATPLLLSFFSLQLFTVGLIFFAAILVKRIDQPFVRKTSWT